MIYSAKEKLEIVIGGAEPLIFAPPYPSRAKRDEGMQFELFLKYTASWKKKGLAMKWQGDKNLSKWFILFLFFWAIFVGEILPVWIQALEGTPSDSPGAKESMFASWSMFLPTVIIYTLLAILLWWLFSKLHWLIVAVIAMAIGATMEFLLFKPQEANGPNVVEDPMGALIFFLVIWPILLVAPYWLFREGRWVASQFSK